MPDTSRETDALSIQNQPEQARRRFLFSLSGFLSISLFNLLIAFGALYYSVRSFDLARGTAEAQQFTQLRQRWYEVKDQLPEDATSRDRGPDRNSTEWRTFRAYWEQAYTEWHVTNEVSKGVFRNLWDGYYEPVFRTVVQRPAFRDTFADLMTDEFSHGPRKEFANLICRFHMEETGKELGRAKPKNDDPK